MNTLCPRCHNSGLARAADGGWFCLACGHTEESDDLSLYAELMATEPEPSRVERHEQEMRSRRHMLPERKITMADLIGRSRTQRLVLARRAFCRELYTKGLTQDEIGELLHRDRSTIADYIAKSWTAS